MAADRARANRRRPELAEVVAGNSTVNWAVSQPLDLPEDMPLHRAQ